MLFFSAKESVDFVANLNTLIKINFGGRVQLQGLIDEVGVGRLRLHPLQLREQTLRQVRRKHLEVVDVLLLLRENQRHGQFFIDLDQFPNLIRIKVIGQLRIFPAVEFGLVAHQFASLRLQLVFLFVGVCHEFRHVVELPLSSFHLRLPVLQNMLKVAERFRMPLDVGFPLAHHGVDIVEKFGEIAARLNIHLLCKEAFHGLKSLQTLPNHLKRISDLFEVQ